MNKFKKLKSAIISFCKPKKLTSLAVAFATAFAMLPIASVSAGAYTYTGLDEIGGRILLESTAEPIPWTDSLVAYEFKINGEIGYCIDPNTPAQKTEGKTVEFTDFFGASGKEVLKLDINTTNEKEKALIAALNTLYGVAYGNYFYNFKVGDKSAKSIMDKYINDSVYEPLFEKIDKKYGNNALSKKYYILSHYAISQLYHQMLGDPTSEWKAWYGDTNTIINELVDFAHSIAKSQSNWAVIKDRSESSNFYICQPKPADGTLCQHLIVRLPKKAKLGLEKVGTNEEIKDLTQTTADKDYLNFEGAEYTLYDKLKTSKQEVAVAQLNRNGNIAKVKYAYSNQDWITKSYFEIGTGKYYIKETKVPSNGYFALSDKKYNVTVTTDDCNNERILDILQLSDTEIVKLKFKKESSNPELTTDNDCYSLDGGMFAVFSDEKSAYDYISDNSAKNNIVRYFITDSNGDCKAISKDGNSWDYNANSDLYKIAYSDSYYAVEMAAPKGFKKYNRPVQMAINGTNGGFVVLSATISDTPLNDPINILVRKKDAVTGQYTNMENAEFTVKYYSGYYYSENELVGKSPERKWILKTDSDGYTHLDESYRADSDYGEPFYITSAENPNPAMPLGTVTIQETKAPTGYKINPELFIRQIKVDEATGSITTFNEIEVPEPRDTVYGNLTIYKTADDSKRGANTAKDVWFNVKSDDGVTDTYVVTTSKGLDGEVTLTNLPVYKASGEYVNYTIKELGYKNADGTYSVPDRYVPPVERTVTLKENVTLSFYFANRLQKTGLIVQKESEDGIISGFYFSVKSDDGKTNKVLVTGEDGTAQLTNLAVYNTSNEKVKYTIDELGFKNADGTYYFPTKYVKPAPQTVTLEDGKSFVVTMKNLLKRGSVELLKTDGTDNPLKGIEFELYNTKTGIVNVINKNSSIMYEAADSKTADTVTKLVTDSNGRIIVNNLLPGDYYFIETDSKGNMPYVGKINFTISPDSLDTLDIQLTVKNNSVFIPEAGGTGNNRPMYIEIGVAVLAFTVLVGAIGLGIRKKKKTSAKRLNSKSVGLFPYNGQIVRKKFLRRGFLMRKSIRKSFTGKLLAVVMMLTLLFAAIPTASAATALKTDQKVNISVKCTKPGYTFELFRVADLKSTTATPFKTEYKSLINSISAEILAGDSKAALDALDNADLSTAVSQGTFTSSATNTTQSFSNLEQGIYYIKCVKYPAGVTSITNSVLALPYYNNGEWVYSYAEINLASKVADSTPSTEKSITNSTKNNTNYTDVSLGDTVNFKLKNTVAGSNDIKLTTYAVYDDMSAGLTLNKNSFKVTLVDAKGAKVADLTKGTDYKVNVTSEGEGKNTKFNVALTPEYLAKSDFYTSNAKFVIVTYSTTVNKYAVVGTAGNPNEDVKLEYGNDSGVDSVPGNKVYVYTYRIGVNKLDEAGNPLAGATFELYKTKADAESQKNAIATGTSDSNGTVKFMNSANEEMKVQSGTYYIVETVAPAGYNVYGKVIEVEIPVQYNSVFTKNTWVKNAPTNGAVEITVTDTIVFFPKTGGYVGFIRVAGVACVGISLALVLAYLIKKKSAKTAK